MKSSIRRRQRKLKRSQQQQTESDEDSQEHSVTNPDNSHGQSSYSSYSVKESSNNNEDECDDDINNEEEGGGTYASSSSSYSVPYPNYINVAPLPMFHGEATECPVSHLSRFSLVCHANNATSTSALLRIFPVTLQSHASLWYEVFVDPETFTWEKVQEEFVQFFIHPETVQEARVRLMSLRQEDEEETVGRYYLKMRRLMKQWPDHGLSDGLLKGLFVDGLKEELREWVVARVPDTLEEAVSVARKLEAAQSFSRVSKQKCGFCEGEGHGERECEGRRRMKEAWSRRKLGVEDERVEEGKRGLRRVVSLMERRNGQCQCWKHQCWKSKLQSSGSGIDTDKNVAAVDQT